MNRSTLAAASFALSLVALPVAARPPVTFSRLPLPGEPVTASASSLRPVAIAVDAAGAIYVADRGRPGLLRIDPDGTSTRISPVGVGLVTELAANRRTGSIVALEANGRVVELDGSGKVLAEPARGRVAESIALAPDGTLFLTAGPAVLRLDGTSIETLATMPGDGPFRLAAGPSGDPFVADLSSGAIDRVRAGRLDRAGSLAAPRPPNDGDSPRLAAPAVPRDRSPAGRVSLAVDSDGSLLILSARRNALHRLAEGGALELVAGDGSPAHEAGFRDGAGEEVRLSDPRALAVGPDGGIWIADTGNGGIRFGLPTLADRAVVDRASGEIGESRVLSVDPLTADSFRWSVASRPEGSSASPFPAGAADSSFVPDAAGRYELQLVARSRFAQSVTVAGIEAGCPTTLTSPADRAVCTGMGTTFTATASQSLPGATWQWWKDGTSIGGANASTYSIGSVVPGNAGSYTAILTDACGTVASTAARLTVGGFPPLPVPPLFGASEVGANTSLTWTAASGATGYTVYSDPSPTGPFTTVVGSTTSLGLATPTPVADLFWVVAPTNPCGIGAKGTCGGTITTASIPDAVAGTPYSQSLSISGAAGAVTWQLANGALPSGITLSTGGLLAGTPLGSGIATFTVRADDAAGCYALRYFVLVVTCAATSLTPATLPDGVVGTAYSEQLTHTGGTGSSSFAITGGALPPPLALSPTGLISGTPNAAGLYSFTATATDAGGCVASQAYTDVRICPVVTITPGTLGPAFHGTAFTPTLTGNGGMAPYTFAVTSGALPAGVTMSTAGAFSGPPTATGSFTFTVTATDANGCTGLLAYTLLVKPDAIADTYPQTLVGNVSVDSANVTPSAYSVTAADSYPAGTTISVFDATSAQGGNVVMQTSGGTMGQFTYNPPPGYEGADTFTYTLSSNGQTDTATVTLTIAGLVWFVNNGSPACTTLAAGCGRLSNPFSTLAAFAALNNGAGNNPAANDDVFVHESATSYLGPVTLLTGQRLIGQDATQSLSTLTSLTPPSSSPAFPVMNSGNGTVSSVRPGAAGTNAINLGQDNGIHGLSVAPASDVGIAKAAGNLGTATLADVTIVAGGSGSGLVLTGSTGTLNYTSGSFTNSGSGTALSVAGGSSTVNVSVPITATSGRAVSVSGRAGGSIVCSGAITATGASTGISVTGPTAANTVSFTGAVSLGTSGTRLNGGTALTVNHNALGAAAVSTSFSDLTIYTDTRTAIDASNGGTLNITTGSVNALVGRALTLSSIALGVTLTGIVSSSSPGQGIALAGVTGSLLNSGSTTVIASATQGILVGTTTANVGFGNTTVNGGTDGISLQNNSAGSRTFGTLTIGGGALPSATGLLSGAGGGNLSVSGAATIAASGNGLDIQNLTAGSVVSFGGGLSVTKSTAGGFGVNLATNTGSTFTFDSLGVTTSNGPAFSATGGGSVTVTNGTKAISATGIGAQSAPAITGNGVTLVATWSGVSCNGSGSGGNCVSMTNVGGTSNFGTGSLAGATGATFLVSGGSGSVTYGGTIAQTNAGVRVIDVQSRPGGSLTFDGAISSTGGGIHLNANGGTTIAFAGGLSLSTTTTPAFTATSSGTVTATQNNGSIVNNLTTTTATALNVANTAIGAAGLTFRSINSSGGSGNGIILNTTGALGGLTVIGDGSDTSFGGNASGGTISGKSGSDNSTTQGSGIYLANTSNVVLRRMTITGTNQNFGIRGTGVNNFILEYCTVSGTNGTAATLPSPENYGEGSIYFGNATAAGLTGSATVTRCLISGGRARNFSIVNNGGTLNRITITGTTFGLNQSFSDANQSFALEARTSGTVANATITGCTFTGSPSDQANFTGQTGSTMDVIFGGVTATPGTAPGNALTNSHPQNVIGGGNLTFASQGVMTFHCRGNTMRDANGSAVTFFKASAGTSLTGFFDNNTIGVLGITDSGSKTGNGIFVSAGGGGSMGYRISNNRVFQINGNCHIYADNTGGSYTANFDIVGNTLGGAQVPNWFCGIAVTNGSPTSSDTVNACAKIGGSTAAEKNTLNLAGNLGIILGASGAAGGHTFNLPGYSGGANETNIENFLLANNSGSFVVDAYTDAPATFGQFTGIGTGCGTPTSLAGTDTSE